MPSLDLVHRPDVILAVSAEYLPSGVVFTVSQRITAQKSTVYRQVSVACIERPSPDSVTPNLVGLADAQTALFTQLIP